jgi:VWFA-related protein
MRTPALLLLCAAALSAQEDMPRRSDIVTSVKVVIVPTTVTDREGNFVYGLNASDFVLFDNGKQQRITQDIAYQPLSMVIAVQSNASVEGMLPKIRKIGAELDTLVLGEQGEAAVLAFDHRVQTMQDFTSESGKIEAAFKKLKPGSSSSAMNDAAMQAINMLRNRPQDRRRILVLISETRDVGGSIRPREVLTAAEFANVIIYSINISHWAAAATRSAPYPRPDAIPPEARHSPTGGVMTPTESMQNRQTGNWAPMIQEVFKGVKGLFIDNPSELYTKYTGGREFSFASQRGLDEAVSALGAEIHSVYLLSYAPNNLDEPGFHNIDVRVKGRPSLEVRSRNGYWIAGQ